MSRSSHIAPATLHRMEEFRRQGYRLPPYRALRTPDQIEGIRSSAAINTALLDLLASELREGMTFTIEPMINRCGREIFTDDDGWTVCTGDGLPSAQWESMFQITETGNEVSTC